VKGPVGRVGGFFAQLIVDQLCAVLLGDGDLNTLDHHAGTRVDGMCLRELYLLRVPADGGPPILVEAPR
jgi:hypothetical protein